MADLEREITENRQRVIALENCSQEIKKDVKEMREMISNHLLHLVPPSFMWIFSILTCLLGIFGSAFFFMLQGR